MYNKFQHGVVIFGLSLSLVSMTANASYAHCRASAATDTEAMSALLCDLSFTGTLPTFPCPTTNPAPPILGTYTVRNNTPITIALGTPTLIRNDSQPIGDAFITTNTCGSTLASGATCLITVQINTNLPINRILRIPVNSRQVALDSPVITQTGACAIPITPPTPPSPFLPCPLNSTSSFGVLAGSAITNTGPTVINGNLGIDPNGSSSVTGFPPGIVNGLSFFADATALAAKNDLTTLYNCLAAQPCGTNIGTVNQAGNTLTRTAAVNVYCSGSTINVTGGALTLSGGPNDVFIFQAGSALNIANADITLIGGLTAANVFWQVTSSATLTPGGATNTFNGTIVALTSITMAAGGGSPAVIVNGRALARNGAVTFNDDTVTVP